MAGQPGILKGAYHEDARGVLVYNNNADFSPIKRAYTIIHPEAGMVRAWQAHKVEQKWLQVIKGSFLVVAIAVSDFDNPQPENIKEYRLEEKTGDILFIPRGYANGLKSLTDDAIIHIYSDLDLADAANDNFKFDSSLWYNWQK